MHDVSLNRRYVTTVCIWRGKKMPDGPDHYKLALQTVKILPNPSRSFVIQHKKCLVTRYPSAFLFVRHRLIRFFARFT